MTNPKDLFGNEINPEPVGIFQSAQQQPKPSRFLGMSPIAAALLMGGVGLTAYLSRKGGGSSSGGRLPLPDPIPWKNALPVPQAGNSAAPIMDDIQRRDAERRQQGTGLAAAPGLPPGLRGARGL